MISPTQRPLPENIHNQNRETTMPPSGFEPTIPASERPQTHALHRAATGTGWKLLRTYQLSKLSKNAGHWAYLFFRSDLIHTGILLRLSHPPIILKTVHLNAHCGDEYSAVTLRS
jgi:hypothetical protein